MASNYETFWNHDRYAVVGNSRRAPFPVLTYGGLKALGKISYAVDPARESIEGDPAYKDLEALPGSVDAVVLELPKDETAEWVRRAAEAGIRHLWIHQGRETADALSIAERGGINVRHGSCAVMYLRGGYHSLHKWINRVLGRY